MNRVSEAVKWWYWSGKYTPIQLVHRGTIGVDEGYFECKREEHEYIMQWYRDIKTMPLEEAKDLMDKRCAKVTRKYFGPKYVAK